MHRRQPTHAGHSVHALMLALNTVATLPRTPTLPAVATLPAHRDSAWRATAVSTSV